MAKRLMVLMGMLAMLLAAAVPAMAQEEAPQYGEAQYAEDDEVAAEIPASDVIEGTVTDISGSVVLVEEDPSDWGDPMGPPESSPTSPKGYFTVTEETEISRLVGGDALAPAAFEELEVGQTVEATYSGDVAQSYPTQGNAASITILEETGPTPGRSATLSFELAVECEPPAGATFFGNVRLGEGGPGIFAEFLDPDGDGLYTGVATLPDRFAPGPAPEGTEPVSLPVQIVQGTGTRSAGAGTLPGEPTSVVKDFGVVAMEAVNAFPADASFCDGGGSDDDGKGGPVGSGGTNGDEGGGVSHSGAAGGIKTLPATGGALLVAGLAGLALVAGGLVARRITR